MAFTRQAVAALAAARAAQVAAEQRAADPRAPWGDSVPPTNGELPTNGSGIPVNQNTAQGISAVYGCCSLIADTVAGLPVELRSGPTRKDSKLLPSSPLLKQPYAEISRRDWWVQFMWSLALRGNFYGQRIEYNGDGSTRQIKPIPNDNVRIERDDRNGGVLKYWFYGKPVPLEQVFHVRYQSTAGMLVGLSPIMICALTFGNAIAQQRFVESFYLNSANPMGVIEVPGYLDRTETRKMYRGWLAAHQSLNKANLPAILTEGAKFNPITINPSDAQLLDALGWSDSTICGRIFRVPPHMIGLVDRTTSWGRGIEQMERGFFANTLIGYLTIGQEALTAEHAEGQYVLFNTTERTRGAVLERAQAASLGMNSGFLVADESRDWFDLPELPDGKGKESFMPINSQLLDAAILALKQAQAMPLVTPASSGGSGSGSGGGGNEHPFGNPNATPDTTGSARPGANTPNSPTKKPAKKRSEGADDEPMSRDQALEIIEKALVQSRERQAAADQALAWLSQQTNGNGVHPADDE